MTTSSLLRAALTVAFAVGFAADCASSKSQRQSPPPAEKGTLTTKDLENSTEPIEKTLAAKAPGLIVERRPDGSLSLRIRGVGTINGSNEPLYVIDGVPVQGGLQGVNPHDIDTIKVLKDPADTGIYGIRGGNGVILITTKKPGKKEST